MATNDDALPPVWGDERAGAAEILDWIHQRLARPADPLSTAKSAVELDAANLSPGRIAADPSTPLSSITGVRTSSNNWEIAMH